MSTDSPAANPSPADRAFAAPASTDSSRSRSWGLDALHLFGLSAFTLAQPLLDRLDHNPGYITQEGLGVLDLALIVLAVLCLPPLALLVVEGGARWFGRPARERTHVFLMGCLCSVLLLALLKTPLERLRMYGIPSGWASLLIAAAVSWWLMRSYRRQGWVSSLATFLAVGLVVFPGMFFASPQISAICFPPPPPKDQAHADNPVPVVVVIFDGLSGMALLDEQHQIDAVRYPNFARLAGLSTYYRNASTVHHRTDNAVPSILSGRFPKGDQPPVRSEYPINLFTLLHETEQYDLTIFEPFTRLCPSELRYLPIHRTRTQRVTVALRTLASVYQHTSIPHDLPLPQAVIPRPWFRQPEADQLGDGPQTGLMVYAWDADRHEQADHFLQCLVPSQRPTLRFLHLAVPHYPWVYLPSGRRCVSESSSQDYPIGSHGMLGEDWGPDELCVRAAWRRYLQQVQYTDRVLGRILDRLAEQGQLEDSLLIVTADHGVAFKAGLSRREPSNETIPSLLPVPLFIKLPGQTAAGLSDRNVESVDILPTIADVIDLEIPVRPSHLPVDGASLLDPREAPRPRKTLITPNGQLAIAPDFPQKFDYVDEMIAAFGTGAANDRLQECELHPDWVGRPPSDFPIGRPSDVLLGLYSGSGVVEADHPDVVPCLFEGEVLRPEVLRSPSTIAVEVNGQIAGVTRTLNDPQDLQAFSVLVDEHHFHTGENVIRFYEVVEEGDRIELRLCRSESL